MSYFQSKSIPRDLFTVIGRFLPADVIFRLKTISNPSFSTDSQVYKELFQEQYSHIDEHLTMSNHKLELEKIYKYKSLTDYACSEGHLFLLEDSEEIPSPEVMLEAYSSHRNIIDFIHEKHFKNFDDDDTLRQYSTKSLTSFVIFWAPLLMVMFVNVTCLTIFILISHYLNDIIFILLLLAVTLSWFVCCILGMLLSSELHVLRTLSREPWLAPPNRIKMFNCFI